MCVCSDDGSATPVQDEQEDARPGSRQSDVSLDLMLGVLSLISVVIF